MPNDDKPTLTPEQKARIAAVHEKRRRDKAGLEALAQSGAEGPFKHGYVMALGGLGAELRLLREAAGLTLGQVAERTGLDETALTRLESGHTPSPSLYHLWQYALALGPKGRFVGFVVAEMFSASLQATAEVPPEQPAEVAATP